MDKIVKDVAKELKTLRKRYTSLAEMAEALHPHPGFEKLDRATISRWLRKPPNRAALAVEILTSKQGAKILRIGEPNTLWVLPSAILAWKAEHGRPHGLLEKKYQVKVKRKLTETDGEALRLLERGEVEIALAARDLINRSDSASRLCTLTKTFITGFAANRIDSASDLTGHTFGYPSPSAIADHISALSPAIPVPKGFASPEECARALLRRDIDGVVGWEPFISQVERAAREIEENFLRLFPIRPGLLGEIAIDIAINMEIAHPNTVRAYLWALMETVKYVEQRKSIDKFQSEIATLIGAEKSHVRAVLINSEFVLDDIQLETLLKLWEREAYDK